MPRRHKGRREWTRLDLASVLLPERQHEEIHQCKQTDDRAATARQKGIDRKEVERAEEIERENRQRTLNFLASSPQIELWSQPRNADAIAAFLPPTKAYISSISNPSTWMFVFLHDDVSAVQREVDTFNKSTHGALDDRLTARDPTAILEWKAEQTGSNVPERCTSIEDAYAHHLSNGMDLFDRAYQDAAPYRAKFLAKTKFYRLCDIYAPTAADLRRLLSSIASKLAKQCRQPPKGFFPVNVTISTAQSDVKGPMGSYPLTLCQEAIAFFFGAKEADRPCHASMRRMVQDLRKSGCNGILSRDFCLVKCPGSLFAEVQVFCRYHLTDEQKKIVASAIYDANMMLREALWSDDE